MATAVIKQNGRAFREERYFVFGGSVAGQYRDVSTVIEKTVGYETAAAAIAAADALVAPGVEPTWDREGVFWTVTSETFTYGAWTDI